MPGGAFAATLRQVREAHARFHGSGKTGEFALAKREGDRILFLLSHGDAGLDNPRSVPFVSDLAEPMRRALSGQSGTLVGLDYRGVRVLAGYEPVAELDLGVVAKIDLAEIRVPFVHAGLEAGAIGLGLILAGTVLFVRIGTPVLRRLAQSERDYRGLFDSATVSLLLVELDGTILDANLTACAIHGRSRAELVGQPASALVHPDYRRAFSQRVASFSGDAPVEADSLYLRKDGAWFPVEVRFAPARYGDRKIMLVAARDVTERKQAEQALQESEDRFRNIFENSPIGKYRTTPDGRILLANHTLVRMLGYASFEELAERDLEKEGYHPQYLRPEFKRRIEEAGRVAGLEAAWLRKDGSVVFVREHARVVRDASGAPLYYEGTAEDITERKRAEEAVRQSEVRLRSVFASMTDLVFSFDKEGRFSFFHAPKGDLYVSPDEFLGKAHAAVMPAHVNELFSEAFNKNKRGEEAEYEYWLKNGAETRWYSARLSPMMLEDQFEGSVAVIRDVTPRKRSEEALRGSEERMRLAVQNLPALVDAFDEAGHIIVWNRECERVTGYTSQEMIGNPRALELLYPDATHRESVLASIRKEQGDFRELEFTLTCKDGGTRTISWSNLSGAHPIPGWATWAVGVDVTERKRAEQELRHHKEILQTILDNAPVMVAILDADATHKWVNRGWERTLGWSLEEAQSRDILAEVYPDPEYRRYVAKFIGDSCGTWGDFKTRVRDGRILDTTWANVRLSDGCNIGIGFDITERKLAEQRAARQATELQAINDVFQRALRCDTEESLGKTCLAVAEALTGSKFGYIGVLNPAGLVDAIAISNPGWEACEMAVSDASRYVKGMPIRGIDRSTMRDEKSRIVNRREMAGHPDRCGVPDGHPEITAFLGVPLKEEGKTIGMIGLGNKEGGYELADQEAVEALSIAVVEVLRYKRAEDALRASEKRHRELMGALQEGIWALDADGKTTFVNEPMAEMLGYSVEEMIGKHLFYFMDEEEIADCREKLRRRSQGMAEQHEFTFRHQGGRRVEALLETAPLWDEGGEYCGAIGGVIDITARRESERALARQRDHLEELVKERTRELEKAQEEVLRRERLAMLGRLTATVSHELRNPLGTIRASVFSLAEAARGKGLRIEDVVDRVERNIIRCDAIIEELLDYARTKKLELSPTRVDDWLAHVLDEQTLPAGITVVRRLTSGAELAIDREKLRRCVVNLVTNACQAMQESEDRGGQLTVATRATADRLEVGVSDTGPGIAPNRTERIFEPLYSTKGFGVGLGLSIVRQIMELHGGGIWIESEPGKGTRATLWLPLKRPEGTGNGQVAYSRCG